MIRRWSSLADYPSPPSPDRADNDDGADEWWSFLNRLKALRSRSLVRNVPCTSPSSLLSPHVPHHFTYCSPQSFCQLWNTSALLATTPLLILLVTNCCVRSGGCLTALWHPVKAQHTALKGKNCSGGAGNQIKWESCGGHWEVREFLQRAFKRFMPLLRAER